MSACTPDFDRQPVRFPGWKAALRQSGLPGADLIEYERAIISFLKFCKDRHAPASVVMVRLHLQSRPGHRMALRWFFKAAGWRGPGKAAAAAPAAITPGRTEASPEIRRSRANEPSLAAADLGREPWERDLITAARTAGLLWRTEETYRGWAAYSLRHAAFAIGAQ